MLFKLSFIPLLAAIASLVVASPACIPTPPVTLTTTVTVTQTAGGHTTPPAPAPTPAPGNGGGSTTPAPDVCSPKNLQCCNRLSSSKDTTVTKLLGLLGIPIPALDVVVGLTCTNIPIIGAGSNSCNQQAVCCKDVSYSGLVAIGCNAINLPI